MNRFGDAEVDFFTEGQTMVRAGVDPTMPSQTCQLPSQTSHRCWPRSTKQKKEAADGEEDEEEEASEVEAKPKRGDPDWWAREEFILAKEGEVQGLVKADDEKLCQAYAELLERHQASCLYSMS